MDVTDAIKTGFADTPYPGSRFIDISATKHDEGIYEYFVGSDQFGHDVKDLRYHSCALSFFTDAAFRYWLPAFMIAELEDPIEADIIGESIAFHLSDAQGAHERICEFSDRENQCGKDVSRRLRRQFRRDLRCDFPESAGQNRKGQSRAKQAHG